MSFRIGNLFVENNFFQAPLAGYSNQAYRHLVIEHGCQITTTEMVSVEGMLRNSANTLELIKPADNEKQICVQLFGSKPESFSKALDVLFKYITPSIIDINAGCPVKKVIKTGAGSALMGTPKVAYDIVRTVKNHAGDIPVSIKFRLGINSQTYLDFAQCVLDAGADIISLHTRTAHAMYGGSADYSCIKNLKEKFPHAVVFASGDIFTLENAGDLLENYKADGLLIARGGIGNPFIFERKNPADSMRLEALSHHFDLLEYYEGRKKAVCEIRKFVPYYLKGMKNSKDIKDYWSHLEL